MMAARGRSSYTALALLLLAVVAVVLSGHGVAAGDKKRGKTVKKQLQAGPVDGPDADDGDDAPEARLDLGGLRGRWMRTRGGRRIAAFTSVPYAQPPVGDLRFKAPVAVEAWGETLESPPLEQGVVCMQAEDTVTTQGLARSEDCLFLNVFTPSALNGSNLPVFVFVHGGLFHEGGAAVYGPEYLLDRDLVLVTLNYRVGALGFLSTGDAASVGNWGLKDQQLALRWVRQHIAAFGGDRDLITLIGQSAGAASAHTHIMSRAGRGLFQRVISLGGTAVIGGLPQTGARARVLAQKLAASLGCPAAPSAELVACLRAKPAAELVAKQAALRDADGGLCPLITWGPVVEDFLDEAASQDNPPFLEQHPVDALTSGLALEVPWMSGINLNEGGLWASTILASKQLEAFDANFDRLVPLCFGYNDTATPDDLPDINQEIREFYFGSNNLTRENLNDVANLFTDGAMLWPLDEMMRLHAAYSPAPAYMYLFSHRGQRSLTDTLGGDLSGGQSRGRGTAGDLGVVHADELLYLFPWAHVVPMQQAGQEAADRRVSDLFIDLLLNFAIIGMPTPVGDTRYKFPWKAVESEELEFIEIAHGGRLLKGAGLLGHRAHFWAALPLSERHVRNMQASIPVRRHDEF